MKRQHAIIALIIIVLMILDYIRLYFYDVEYIVKYFILESIAILSITGIYVLIKLLKK